MAMSKQDKANYRNDYARDNYDNIRLQTKKADCIPALVDKAVMTGLASSRQAYIIEAIKQRLAADGVTLDE